MTWNRPVEKGEPMLVILVCVCVWGGGGGGAFQKRIRAPKLSTLYIMTSSNGNIFRVTGHLCREFTASDVKLWCFLWSVSEKRLSKQSWGWWVETLSRRLWRHCNDKKSYPSMYGQDILCGISKVPKYVVHTLKDVFHSSLKHIWNDQWIFQHLGKG